MSLRTLALLLLLGCSFSPLRAQEGKPAETALEPQAMVDPLRDAKLELRDTWQKLVARLEKNESPRAAVLASWALFHEFDVDYFSLGEGDADDVLGKYERQALALRKKYEETLPDDPIAQLAVKELSALLDDIQANRLQNARPEGSPADSKEMQAWNAKFEEFQFDRATRMQERGKLVASLYREGQIDAIRMCVVLLERQIAERVLLEHREMTGGAALADKFLAERIALLTKQKGEWKQIEGLFPESKLSSALIDIGQQVCSLHALTIELAIARLQPPATDKAAQAKADERIATLVKQVFAAYQELHRNVAAQRVGEKITVEQLARIHDLRMYTAIWFDPALAPGDVVADAIEVAAMWEKLSAQLEKSNPRGLDAHLAQAKKLESAITRDERKGPAAPEKKPQDAGPQEEKPTEAKPVDAPKVMGEPTPAKRK